MREILRKVASGLAILGLTAASLTAASPAQAAAVTLANNITTTDLNSLTLTPQSLAAKLMGTGVTIVPGSAKFVGDKRQAGEIDIQDGSIVSFNQGLIMSSGNIADIVGPNKSESTTSDMLGGPDTDLNTLIANTKTVYPQTFDAAVLEFDFVPNANHAYFTYVFSSEEYLEWVNLFNDVFAFYVNGTNCATTPDNQIVSIDSINNLTVDPMGNPITNNNPDLYRDNSFWSQPAQPLNIEADGLTVEMICSANVNQGVSNHIKLAIADTSDQVLDSNVMIKTGSLSTVPPESCNNKIDDDADSATDMDDTQCSSTVVVQPPSDPKSGIGIDNTNPPFTGTEGHPVYLDANKIGWDHASKPAGVKVGWKVSLKSNAAVLCEVTPATPQPLNQDGTAPLAYATCPSDAEYVARADVYDSSGGQEWDNDIDFFIQNAPPTVDYDPASLNPSVEIGTAIDVLAYTADPGSDAYTCTVSWGDKSADQTLTVGPDPIYGADSCGASHTYAATGTYVVTITAKDSQGDSAVAVTLATVSNPPGKTDQTISLTTALPTSSAYGSTFTVDASSDSQLVLAYGSSGGCTNSGAVYTITSGTTACSVTLNQAGNETFNSATQLSGTVATSKVAITVTADAKSKLYGTADPALTYKVTSGALVGSDTLAGSLTRAAGETLGNYAINVGTLSGSGNYAVTYVSANFNIYGVAPVVTTAPASTSVVAGSALTLSAAASGTPTPTVQWQVAAAGSSSYSNIGSATSTSYTFTPAATDNGKQYRAVFTNAAGSATSAAATVSVLSISSFTPTSGTVGTTVTITGTNFTSATAVKFNGLNATSFTVVSATSITAVAPTGVTSGTLSVTKGGLTATSATSFTVNAAAPTISGISPTSGGVGTSVTITGTNLTGATAVTFAGTTTGSRVAALFKVLSATSILTSVPAGTGTGVITVTTAGGSASSVSFKGSTTLVVPTVTAYSVTAIRSATATSVNLTGTNFGGTTKVALNGVSLTYTVNSATSMTVSIPDTGVATGPIKVTTAGGTSANTIVYWILSAPTALTAGTSHSCAILADNTAKCWGLNTNGQLGDASTTQRTSPVAVSGLTGVISISAGGAFTCAVTAVAPATSGTVKCWGLNTNGQLGDGTTTQRTSPVATSITNAVSVATGTSHACALLADGTVKCWGLNSSGQIGTGVANTTNVTAPTNALSTAATNLTLVSAIAAGGNTTCALLTTGSMKCWGLNTNGQLGDTTVVSKSYATQVSSINGTTLVATKIAVGTSHTCALISGGTLRCWGLNSSGQVGNGVANTTNVTSPTAVLSAAATNLTGVTSISTGAAHTCAIVVISSVNTARCWGNNGGGRLGNTSTTNSSYPVATSGTNAAVLTQIVAGGSHTLALVPSTVLAPRQGAAWGANTNGQLGDASTTGRTSPVLLGLL